ncbi:unnamed protein product [Allacma fusca]|uniref:Uncharacterized protein n=1 Tax=Allacma fusca TaxID=39272 RepID=A0A8J2JZQ6_9HEXA|nr:unnamed protein product [Allacma fusca]
MRQNIVHQRSQSLGDLPIRVVLQVKNVPVNVQFQNNDWIKVDLSFDDDLPLPGSNEPAHLEGNDLSIIYHELQKQVRFLNRDRNLEKWLRQSKVKLPKGVDLTAVKDKLREFEKKFLKDEKDIKEDQIPYYEDLQAKLQDLNEDDLLEEWLDTLEHKPKDVSWIKQKLQDYFKAQGKNSIPRRRTEGKSSVNPSTKSSYRIPRKLWERFLEMPILQKRAIVVGIAIVVTGAGILTWTLIGAAFPLVLALVQNQVAEFLVQFASEMTGFRNDLLSLTAEQAKPLSRAWRDQFLICKHF